MTEAWNGRPPAPLDQVEGWHWLRNKGGEQKPFSMEWVSEDFSDAPTEWRWDEGDEGDGPPDVFAKYFEYIAPCPTPDQIAAQIAEAVKAERDACAVECDAVKRRISDCDGGDPHDKFMATVGAIQSAAAIRARGETA